jgi:hypothetical protein
MIASFSAAHQIIKKIWQNRAKNFNLLENICREFSPGIFGLLGGY